MFTWLWRKNGFRISKTRNRMKNNELKELALECEKLYSKIKYFFYFFNLI